MNASALPSRPFLTEGVAPPFRVWALAVNQARWLALIIVTQLKKEPRVARRAEGRLHRWRTNILCQEVCLLVQSMQVRCPPLSTFSLWTSGMSSRREGEWVRPFVTPVCLLVPFLPTDGPGLN
jgi:hypothetical protein